jgi:hypothetical protein
MSCVNCKNCIHFSCCCFRWVKAKAGPKIEPVKHPAPAEINSCGHFICKHRVRAVIAETT